MKNKTRAAWLVSLLAVACASGDNTPTGTPPNGGDPGGAAPPGTAAVTIGDNFFRPAQVTLARVAGQAAVTWTWSGSDQHNVTFDAGGPNSVTQSSGTFTRTLTDAGSFTYICTIHGRAVMSGTVEVQ